MQGGIRMDSSLFSYREGQGPLADPRPSLYENEGEDAGAASPSHMRNYLATIDRLPAKRSAAGRWTSLQAAVLEKSGTAVFSVSNRIANLCLSQRMRKLRPKGRGYILATDFTNLHYIYSLKSSRGSLKSSDIHPFPL